MICQPREGIEYKAHHVGGTTKGTMEKEQIPGTSDLLERNVQGHLFDGGRFLDGTKKFNQIHLQFNYIFIYMCVYIYIQQDAIDGGVCSNDTRRKRS